METLKNNFAAIATISACIGGILLAFGNDYGIIGLIPALIYTFTNQDC
jgi:hypothetical protein